MIDYLIRKDEYNNISIGTNKDVFIFKTDYKFLRISKFGFDYNTLEFIHELIESIMYVNLNHDYLYIPIYSIPKEYIPEFYNSTNSTKIIIRELLETKKEVWISVKEGYHNE